MSDSIADQPLVSRLRALALQAGPDGNWVKQTMEDAIEYITKSPAFHWFELQAALKDLNEAKECIDKLEKSNER